MSEDVSYKNMIDVMQLLVDDCKKGSGNPTSMINALKQINILSRELLQILTIEQEQNERVMVLRNIRDGNIKELIYYPVMKKQREHPILKKKGRGKYQ